MHFRVSLEEENGALMLPLGTGLVWNLLRCELPNFFHDPVVEVVSRRFLGHLRQGIRFADQPRVASLDALCHQ